jgi:hypothetical protein
MSIVNGYCTLSEAKAVLDIDDTTDDAEIEDCVETASRDADDYCGPGRKFWQDTTVVDRKYWPTNARVLYVDDISTTTGLVVKIDDDDDGTFETTLTINTDYIVAPVNAAAEFPVRPFTQIVLLDGALSGWQRLSSGRPYVQVTAKFGWSAVPEQVKRATLLQTKLLFKADDTTFGTFQAGIDGTARNVPRMDPVAAARLERFVRFEEVDDGA